GHVRRPGDRCVDPWSNGHQGLDRRQDVGAGRLGDVEVLAGSRDGVGAAVPRGHGRVVSAPERKRVMIVDDHPMWIDALSEDLTEVGFEIVAVAKNGTECLTRARATRPEVVVMDLQIPEPDGATCTEILVKEFPEIQVLVMSASGERDDVLRAMKAGAKGYLVKSA